MKEPAYLRISAEIGDQIRSGALPPGTRLPSYVDLAAQHGVSDIVIRRAMDLLRSRGLVRTIERVGAVVAERPTLIRIAPERQLETADLTFSRESGDEFEVDRDVSQTTASDDVAEGLGIEVGAPVTHVETRIRASGSPAVVSDYYEPLDLTGGTEIEDPAQGAVAHNPVVRFATIGWPADTLEETLSLRTPAPRHAEFLGLADGESTVTILQRFLSGDRVVQLSYISFPPDRYAGFAFRMQLPGPDTDPNE